MIDKTEQATCFECGELISRDEIAGLCATCLIANAASSVSTAAQMRSDEETPVATSIEERSIEMMAKIEDAIPQIEFEELIGCGGMGCVYRARQLSLDRTVAIKVLHKEKPDLTFSERFRHEARTLAKLNHPNIVTVHDFGEEANQHYIVMEYVEGRSLRDALDTRHAPPDLALDLMHKVCVALKYAHDAGVVHRDIKPGNILIDEGAPSRDQFNWRNVASVKVVDFGLARFTRRNPHDISLTNASDIMGTPYYMAPEQRSDPKGVDHRADIFSVGVLMYELLTGTVPQGRFPSPSELVDVDPAVDDLISRCLQRDMENRYANVDELLTELDKIRSAKPNLGKTSTGKDAANLSHTDGFSPRQKTRWVTAFGSALLLAVGFFAGVLNLPKNAEEENSENIKPAKVIEPAIDTTPFYVAHQDTQFSLPFEDISARQFDGYAENGQGLGSFLNQVEGGIYRELIYKPPQHFSGFDQLKILTKDGRKKISIFVSSRKSFRTTQGTPIHARLRSLFKNRDTSDSYLILHGNNSKPTSGNQNTIVGVDGALWRFSMDGKTFDPSWKSLDFDDSDWQEGPTAFGRQYHNNPPARTDTPEKPARTSHFRHTFFHDAKKNKLPPILWGYLLHDDGAAVYLNGQEIARQRLAANATDESFSMPSVCGHEEEDYDEFAISSALIRDGKNVLAVKVHQVQNHQGDKSYDLLFDFALSKHPLGLLADDPHFDLTVELVASPKHGKIDLRSDGTFDYVPEANFAGYDQFKYRAVSRDENQNTIRYSNESVAEIFIYNPSTKVVLATSVTETAEPSNEGRQFPRAHVSFSRTPTQRSNQTVCPLTVRYELESTLNYAENGVDYIAVENPHMETPRAPNDYHFPLRGTVEIPVYSGSTSVLIVALKDDLNEGDETFTLKLLPSPFYRINPGEDQLTITIHDTPDN